MGLAAGLTSLIGCRILLGLGESIYLPGGSRIVSLLFTRAERGLPVGLFDAGTRTGLFLEGLLIPWMLTRFGWRWTFMVVGFTALLWLVPWLLATPTQLRGVPPGGARLPGKTPAPAGSFGRWLESLLTNRNLVGICLVYFAFDYYWYLLVTWLPDYLVSVRHFSLLKTGLTAALPFLVFGASEPVGGWIADRLIRGGMDETKARKGIVTVAFSTGVFLVLAMRATDSRTAVALLVGACLVGLSTGNLLVMLQSSAPPDEIGLWTGIYNFIGNIAGILAPLITGALIERTGSYTPGFVLAAVVLAVGLVCCWCVVGKLRAGADNV
jgi:MFS family permease